MYYVVARIRDHTAEYWAYAVWTQDVAYAQKFSKPPSMPEGADSVVVPFNPALNIDKVCLVSQDNPRQKECLRHG